MENAVVMVMFNVNLIDLWHYNALGLKGFGLNGDISIPSSYYF